MVTAPLGLSQSVLPSEAYRVKAVFPPGSRAKVEWFASEGFEVYAWPGAHESIFVKVGAG